MLFSLIFKKGQKMAKWTNLFISGKLFQKRPIGNHGNDQKYSRNDIPNVTSHFLLVFSTVEAS